MSIFSYRETFILVVWAHTSCQILQVSSQKEGGSGAAPHPSLLKRYSCNQDRLKALKKRLRKLWFLVPSPTIEGEISARQEQVTRVIFIMISVGVIIMNILVFALFFGDQEVLESVLIILAIDILVFLGWLMIARRRWRVSAFLLPLVFLFFSGYMVYTVGPVTTTVLQLVLAVLLAGMLSGNTARWIMVGLSILVYLAAGWASGGLDLETTVSSGTLLVVTLVAVAFLESFFAEQLNKSLVTVREREAKLQSIFRAAPIGIGMVVGRVIQEANPTLCQMTGYTREELIGKNARMLYPAQEEYDYVGTEKYRQIGEQGLGTVETRWRRKDGVIRDILLSSVPLNPGDLTRGVTFSALDITESNEARDALQKSKNLLRESQKIARIGHYALDVHTGIWESSDGLNELFGIDPAYQTDLAGWLQIVHPDDREAMAAYFADEVVRKRQEFDREYRIVRVADGATRWVHGLGRLEFDGNGNLVRMIGNIQDISERKQAEITLRENAASYQAVVENQTEFIVRWKPDGTRTFVNEAYLRYFDLTMDEALSSDFLPLVLEEDRRAVEEKVSRLVSGKSFSEADVHQVIKPDGSVGWQEWSDTAIYNDRGELVEFQSIGRDITERKLADEALRIKTAELEALFSISSHLRAAQSADAMLPLVVAEMRRVLRSDANAVILLDPDEEHFTYALSDGPLAVNAGLQFSVEKSISGFVLQTRQPYVTENLSSDPRKASALRGDDDLGPAIIVPVVSESEFLGVLFCARKRDGASQHYSTPEIRLLTAIGEMVGNALRRARLYDQAMTRLRHVQTLHSIDMAISANLDLSVILEVLLTQGVVQLDVDAACILLLDPHTHMLEYAAGNGFRTREIKSTRLRLGEGLPGMAAIERRVLHVPNLLQIDDLVRKHLLDEGFVSYQAAPLIAKGQLQGVLETFNRRPMAGGEEQTGFLETLATQAAIAIDNSQLFSDLQRSNFELEIAYDATIEGWSRALELRDEETEGHTLRVTDMTVRLAQEIGVMGAELIHIRRGALLHDIGKMGIPDRILLKPGRLVGEEWEIMKRHTVYAFEMLRPIEFLRPAIDIPYCHHERWDGTGYPRQLKAEQIPLSARLFAVADVWDALTSDRPYRKAWPEEKALDYILTNRGLHFDPQVVELFLGLRKQGGEELGFD
jgi:PAS domain S-box-containing protein/putative nucleotidyltransferase with HDIG domain